MKKLITELAKREGKKSQVKVGDLRETVSKLQDIIAEEIAEHILVQSSGGDDTCGTEFLIAVGKKINTIIKKKKSPYLVDKVTFNTYVTNAIFVPELIEALKKKAKK